MRTSSVLRNQLFLSAESLQIAFEPSPSNLLRDGRPSESRRSTWPQVRLIRLVSQRKGVALITLFPCERCRESSSFLNTFLSKDKFVSSGRERSVERLKPRLDPRQSHRDTKEEMQTYAMKKPSESAKVLDRGYSNIARSNQITRKICPTDRWMTVG